MYALLCIDVIYIKMDWPVMVPSTLSTTVDHILLNIFRKLFVGNESRDVIAVMYNMAPHLYATRIAVHFKRRRFQTLGVTITSKQWHKMKW